jgi:cell division protein FtsA
MTSNLIFALDIGTRSIVGLVMQETHKGLEIIAFDHLEHQNRAMVDGQIHDIEEVAKGIKIVKEKIETKIGQTLNQVAVAAAGRALRTVRLKVNNDLGDYKEIHRDDILRLELQAVQEAQGKLAVTEKLEAEESLNYHCVGYSVVNYELDGFKIGNLYSQKGKNMGVEIIATFLPRVVVDSLFAALNRVDLEMISLTLEPIAASAVVVPPSMRQLNIALVDIGAGTSDIAITDDGSIVGYGMVPVAGDEITEKISQQYLVDFYQAENIKKSLLNLEEITFSDVLGIEHTFSKKEILDSIFDSVQSLAKQISGKIIELNGRTPQAVISIGGGSLTPLLKDLIAENLGLSKQRVAIRGREAISDVFGAQELMGPEAVTPIGIAVTSYEHKGLGFARVTVNNRPIRLFEVNRGTVADALLSAGVSMRKTQPRLGLAMTVTVNGELKIIKGGRGKPAVIKLNGHDVTIDASVKHNDVIEFVEAVDGENARGYVHDVVPDVLSINISINEEPFEINPVIKMNGQLINYSNELKDNARIVYYLPRTIAEVLEISGHGEVEADSIIHVNDRIVDSMSEVLDGDDIVIQKEGLQGIDSEIKAIQWVDTDKRAVVVVEQAPAYIQSAIDVKDELNSAPAGVTIVYVNKHKIEIPRVDVILTDILIRVDFPLKPPQVGMRLDMKVNSVSAEFTTPLKNGDNVSLGWKL